MNRCSWCNLKNKKYVEYHDNEWGKISYKGIDGYILNEYIDFNIA